MAVERLTRRKKRNARGSEPQQPRFKIEEIEPLTVNQQRTFDAFADGQHMMLHGTAGTGKTFLSLYLTLEDVMSGCSLQNKVVIIRSVVPTREMGFLPGNAKEKTKVYEAPYYSVCSELFGRGEAYDILRSKSIVEFMSTSYVRGITLNDCYVIVDEAQNMTFQELNSIITRAGKNARFILCGDIRQDDLSSERRKEYSGILDFMKIIKKMPMFDFIEFQVEDIVRSALVKEYLIQRDNLGL